LKKKDIVRRFKEFDIDVSLVHSNVETEDEMEKEITEMAAKKLKKYEETKWCLLFRDKDDKVYNLMFKGVGSGLGSQFTYGLVSYSGTQAICAFMILLRSFSCFVRADVLEASGIKPGLLGTFIFIFLQEEIGNIWLNIHMIVQGYPSTAAFVLKNKVVSDWPKKGVPLILAIASAIPSDNIGQSILTLFGISWALVLLAANLGCRVWFNLGLNPVTYSFYGSSSVSLILATVLGLFVPYIGNRSMEASELTRISSVVSSAMIVALVFLISGFPDVYKYLIVGSEDCSQDAVTILGGGWWMVTFLLSMWSSLRMITDKENIFNTEEEVDNLTEKHDSSPVGIRICGVDDLYVYPRIEEKANMCCATYLVVVLGVILAILIGGYFMSIGIAREVNLGNLF